MPFPGTRRTLSPASGFWVDMGVLKQDVEGEEGFGDLIVGRRMEPRVRTRSKRGRVIWVN